MTVVLTEASAHQHVRGYVLERMRVGASPSIELETVINSDARRVVQTTNILRWAGAGVLSLPLAGALSARASAEENGTLTPVVDVLGVIAGVLLLTGWAALIMIHRSRRERRTVLVEALHATARAAVDEAQATERVQRER